VRNLYVPLTDTAVEQLRELARHEYRDTKAQAAWLILEGLRRAGLEPESQAAEAARSAMATQQP
jgi:hypothetical protein